MGEMFRFEMGGDGELPEELMKLLQGLASQAMSTGLAHDPHDDEVRPSEEQLSLVPGDYVAITHSEDKADSEFIIALVADPELHAETYPDWEDRLLRSYLLLTWYSRNNQTGKVGWVPRSKLVKATKEQWETMMGWITTGNGPSDSASPDWLISLYNHSLYGLWKANQDGMPQPIVCPECASPAVLVKLVKTETLHYCMGTKPEEAEKPWHTDGEGMEFFVVSPYHKDYTTTSSYRCIDCGHEGDLPDEIEMYG